MQGDCKNRIVSSFLLAAVIILFNIKAQAQALPPLQPEQDACNAISLCGYYFSTPFSYTGHGKKFELELDRSLDSKADCHSETNSVWLRLKIAQAGNIVFVIVPADSVNDYDFSVFNVTGNSCPDSMSLAASKIRCNGNCNANCPGFEGILSSPGGMVGLDYFSNLQFVPSGTLGNAYLQHITAQKGDEFLILVNNFSQSASGFGIDFTGSTALFENNSPPLTVDSIITDCVSGYTKMTVMLGQPVLCKSIAADGSDFTLSSSGIKVVAASSIDCIGQEAAYTRQLMITLDTSLVVGQQLSLHLQTGSDGNTLLDLCGNSQLAGIAKSFEVRPPLKVNAGADTAVCAGGNIQLGAGLDGTSPGRIRWQPATFLNSGNINNPLATPANDMTYVVLVAPVGFPAFCYYRDTIRIKVLKGFEIVTPDSTLCRPEKIAIHLRGDSAFTYNWSPADYLSGTTGIMQNAVPEKSVTYTIKASYPGCKDSLQTININVIKWPDLVTSDTVVCEGHSVPLQVVGGSNFTHVWSPSLYLSDAMQINPFATPKSSVTYAFTTSYAGCTDSVQSVSIGVEPLPDIDSLTFNTLCIGTTIQMSPSVAPTSYSNYSYQWEPAASFNDANARNAIYTALNTGMISLKVYTPHGCVDTLLQVLSVSPFPAVNAGKDMTVVEGQTITLQGSADPIPTTIKWTAERYLSNDTILNPIATLPASQNFVLSISNEYGCTAKDSVFITVLKDIYIPNAFSPNGDGINDVWNIPGLSSYQYAKTQVLDRWGHVVFISTGYIKPWDGTLKGRQLPVGVYYYLIDIYRGTGMLKGSITLIR
jgi:gliding motility-associated-like protein